MMDDELKPHVEDISRALENKVDKEEIAEELDNYVRVYRVNLEDAKRSIVRKFGGKPSRFSAGVNKKLIDLKSNDMNVNLVCRVVSANTKRIDSNGSEKEPRNGRERCRCTLAQG
jgi:hypothetical protein